jgi:hypothetical protein
MNTILEPNAKETDTAESLRAGLREARRLYPFNLDVILR